MTNSVVAGDQLALYQPEIETWDDVMRVVHTYTAVSRPPRPVAGEYQGAYMLEAKMKSRQAIEEEADEPVDLEAQLNVTCKDVNQVHVHSKVCTCMQDIKQWALSVRTNVLYE